MADSTLDEKSINTIRFLAVDAVQMANAGHPGAPMGAASMAYVLWDRFLKHNPSDPTWPDRNPSVTRSCPAMSRIVRARLAGAPAD